MTAQRLIFLFGMPRSGTTWIGKTFDSHPEVDYRHEPDSQFRMDGFLPLHPDPDEAERYRDAVTAYCRDQLHRCTTRTCGKRPLFPKAGEPPWRLKARYLRLYWANLLERLGATPQWSPPRHGRYLVWKSIESLGRLGTLLRLCPDSRGVVILRHPCGYAASVLRGERSGRFQSKQSITEDFQLFALLLETPYARRIGLTLEDIRAARPEARLAWLWILYNEKARGDIEDQPQAALIRYEDLCRAPRDGFRHLFRFCGLDWHPQTEAFLKESTSDPKDDYYSVKKDPLEAAYRWRRELTPEQIETIETLVQAHPVGRAYYALDGAPESRFVDIPEARHRP